MSLASRRNVRILVPAVLTLTFVLVAAFAGRTSEPRLPAAFAAPVKPLTALTGKSPAAIALESVRTFFRRAPVAVIAPAGDPAAQTLAMKAATTLRAPVLLDGPAVDGLLKTLRTQQVLTIGAVGDLTPDRVGAKADPAAVTKAIGKVRDGSVFTTVDAPHSNALVVSRSLSADAVSLTNARTAGATVVNLPGGDPRRDPKAAALFKQRGDSPIVTLGNSLGGGFPYALKVVRHAPQQPGGGYFVFPGRTMIALYGYPGAASLGVLGEQGLKASIARAKKTAAKYQKLSKKPVVPTFEIIATVAAASAGKDKDYSSEASVKLLRPWVEQAQKAGMYVVLDLQPGRSDFLSQAKRYESLLALPHVGLALDPEWRLTKHQKPLRQIGSVKIAEINRTVDWLAALTHKHSLPQKLLILHQFQQRMIKGRGRLDMSHTELSVLIHVDGQGSQPAKQGTWRTIRRGAPRGVFWGWKNFYDEDKPTLSVKKTWTQVKPRPDFISYQ